MSLGRREGRLNRDASQPLKLAAGPNVQEVDETLEQTDGFNSYNSRLPMIPGAYTMHANQGREMSIRASIEQKNHKTHRTNQDSYNKQYESY